MTDKSLKRMRWLAITIFLLGTVSLAVAYSLNRAKGPAPPVGFTMISTQTFTPRNSEVSYHVATKVRYQKSNGEWRLVTTYYKADGSVRKTDSGFGQSGQGVFRVDGKNKLLNFISPKSAALTYASEETLRNDPRFLREDTMLGYKVIVQHNLTDDGSSYIDISYAPALQSLPVKTVYVTEAGTTIIEPTKIVLGEPATEDVSATPNYPVSYEEYEQKLQSIEKAGNAKTADEMRHQPQPQKK
jgi:hypothetical protein